MHGAVPALHYNSSCCSVFKHFIFPGKAVPLAFAKCKVLLSTWLPSILNSGFVIFLSLSNGYRISVVE
jgi:hypothetical protein